MVVHSDHPMLYHVLLRVSSGSSAAVFPLHSDGRNVSRIVGFAAVYTGSRSRSGQETKSADSPIGVQNRDLVRHWADRDDQFVPGGWVLGSSLCLKILFKDKGNNFLSPL